MLYVILLIVVIILVLSLVGGAVYMLSKGRIFKWPYHDAMDWHLPDDKPQEFDGCSFHARCKICGKSIMMDSQGNWFTISYESEK